MDVFMLCLGLVSIATAFAIPLANSSTIISQTFCFMRGRAIGAWWNIRELSLKSAGSVGCVIFPLEPNGQLLSKQSLAFRDGVQRIRG